MAEKFLFILLLTILEKVETKTFVCIPGQTSDGKCVITDVVPQDSNIELEYQYQYPMNNDTIERLTIQNSTMDDIPRISSENILSLEHLNCIGCGLADITKHSFTRLGNLVALNISFGLYPKLQKNLFSQLLSLTELNASHGAISEIDDTAFFNLKKLKRLDLQHNNIRNITSNMFAPLISIRFLDLSYNHIKVLNDGLFVFNFKLNYLQLTHNDINKIDGRITSACSNLVLSYNELSTLDSASFDAKNVWVDHNRLEQLSISSTVQFLNANQNVIEKVMCDGYDSRINILDLHNNSLTELGCVSSLTQLTELNLGYNNLGKLNQSSFAALTNLTKLNLKSANIGKLMYGVFSHQNKLQQLDISYNQLGNIELEMLLAARGLQTLNVEGNNITEFSYKDLRTAFANFNTLGIGDNDFNCTFLAQAIEQLNSDNIDAFVSSGNKVKNSHNVNGIGCHDETEIATPSWVPSVTTNDSSTTGDEINPVVTARMIAIIQQVAKLSQIDVENEKKFLKSSEDIGAIKQQILRINSDTLTNKAEILKIEITKNNNATTSSNTLWTQINLLNNINLEKQQISSRVQTQEMSELKFEIEKNIHRISDAASKMEKLMKEVTILQSSSSLGSISGNTKGESNLIKNLNIILFALIAAFAFTKDTNL